MNANHQGSTSIPSLNDLGHDLLLVSAWRRTISLLLPFFWCGMYFFGALADNWPLAVFSAVALSFVTYGSTSHDLVHRNLGLPHWANDVLLSAIEMLALRSGHAYQAAHLQHHARFPHDDDIEAKASRLTWLGAIAEGLVFQWRVGIWALRNAERKRAWIVSEGIACLTLIVIAVALWPVTPIFAIYVALMIMGSWIIPLVTSYLPHDPNAKGELFQTRVFRGVIASAIALEHLYHLEHHLYPAVPHHNWPALAKRVDPYFTAAGVQPVRFWF